MKTVRAWAVALLLCGAGLHADDALITIHATITTSEAQGGIVRGSMQLSLVNATDMTLSNVRLQLTAPTTGRLGEGTVDVGTIDVDATAAPIVDFQVDKSFFDSTEPFVIGVLYRDTSGKDRETSVVVRRIGGAL